MHTLDQLNALSPEDFAAALDGVFEHAPWVAGAAAGRRPFPTVVALHDALMAAVHAAPTEACLDFLRGHPPLAPKALADSALADRALADRALTAASRAEQTGLGMAGIGDQFGRFETASAAYERRFGIPFIVCVRRLTPPFVLRALERRLANAPEQERAAALTEIGYITRLRLVDRVTGPGLPSTTGHLSSHVLDTVRGKAAEGVRIELLREDVLIKQAITNYDGRTDGPLLAHEPLRIGRYELRFHLNDYVAALPNQPDPPWYDIIPIRFGVAEPEGRYHVPLLLGAWTYTTYRGS